MANWFCNNGDGLTTGYWSIVTWKRATVYGTGAIVRQRGGQITIGVAQDFTHGNIWFMDISNGGQWNDSPTADPALNSGGIATTVTAPLFPAFTAKNFSTITANFGASPFVLPVLPSGYSSVNTANGSAVTWNPADINASITLSGGNLIAAGTGNPGTNYSGRATASFSAGLIYWEITVGWQTSGAFMRDQTNLPDFSFGLANSTMTLTTLLGADANGIGWVGSTGNVTRNNATSLALHTLSPVAAGNERVYKNLGASGTSAGVQPAFPLTNGGTVADNTVTWTEVTGKTTDAWNTGWARMTSLYSQRLAAGDVVWVGDNHRENESGVSPTVTFGGSGTSFNYWYSVDHTNASPGPGTLLPGAQLSFYNSGPQFAGAYWFNGITLLHVGSINGPTNVGNASIQRYTNCNFQITNTGGGCVWAFSSGGQLNQNDLRFDNCTFTNVTANNNIFAHYGGRAVVKGGSISTAAGGNLFWNANNNIAATALFECVDLSGVGGVVCNGAAPTGLNIQMIRCKVPNSTAFFTGINGGFVGYAECNWFNCDLGANVQSHGRADSCGWQFQNKIVVRTGGASDGLVAYSEQITNAGSGSTFASPFRSLPMDVWNTVINANRVVTIYGILLGTATPFTNAEFWLDVKYLGDPASMLGALTTTMAANPLVTPANLTADTSAWDTLVPARANSTAYVIGNLIKVASNPGRVFYCGTAGTSAGSPPAGYASAVDGGNVTDGAAVFRAGIRFSVSVTLSSPQPQQVGLLSIQALLARGTAITYIDPLPVLS